MESLSHSRIPKDPPAVFFQKNHDSINLSTQKRKKTGKNKFFPVTVPLRPFRPPSTGGRERPEIIG